jgi:hypothetical protein
MAAVSRYKLEALSTDQFEPREKFVDIVGIQIDSNGNVTGWAANDRKETRLLLAGRQQAY